MRHLLKSGRHPRLNVLNFLQLLNAQQTGLCRQDRVPGTIKQFDTQFGFDTIEIHGQRGLCDKQALCGACQILFFGNGENIVHFINNHCLDPFPSKKLNLS